MFQSWCDHWKYWCTTNLDFSVNVVCVGIHEVENKELYRFTEVSALQCGKVQKHMDRYLKNIIKEREQLGCISFTHNWKKAFLTLINTDRVNKCHNYYKYL